MAKKLLRKKRSHYQKVETPVKTFNCRQCGSVVNIKILGQTVNVTCQSCNSVIDASDPNFKILQEGVKKVKFHPDIPLSSRGKIAGILWEVIGFVVKSDSGYFWHEYLLFNPYHGYRWIVNADGHYVFYKRVHLGTSSNPTSIYKTYKNKKYVMFNRGTAKVEYVAGEFYWRVKKGDITNVSDLIKPPFALSVERDNWEENWTHGYHIEPSLIETAFKLENKLPRGSGIGMVQPSPYSKEVGIELLKTLIMSLGAMLAIFILSSMFNRKELIFEDIISLAKANSKEVIKTSEFEISGSTGNVLLQGKANVFNSWVYTDALLVNAETLKGIPLAMEISYYKGSDWSEGSQKNSTFAFNVPDGKYYLSIKTQMGGGSYSSGSRSRNNTPRDIQLQLYRNGRVFSNFIILAVLLIIGPIFFLLRTGNFEVKRWENSDFSPYSD